MVKKIFRFLGLLIDRISRYCWYISGTIINLMALVITYNVIKRYIFRHQDAYAYLIACICMLLCAVFAWAYVQKQGQHIRVDLMDRYYSKKFRGILLNVISPFIGLICISIIVWESWGSALFALQSGDTFGSGVILAPSWPPRMMIFIGAVLLCLVFIVQIVRHIASMKNRASTGEN
jgi:TRAP-type mannitol/chloroaromatic compound transport system permease small subunit